MAKKNGQACIATTILAIDIGGSRVKFMTTGANQTRVCVRS
jgi:hypothetical protein